jgi:hypothetical protein
MIGKKLFVYYILGTLLFSILFTSNCVMAAIPSVTTNNAEGIGETNTTLRGTWNSGAMETMGFEYGLTTGYGSNASYSATDYESYEYMEESYTGCYGTYYLAQTFKATSSHMISIWHILCRKDSGSGNFNVGLRAVSGGYPSGSNLATGTVDTSDWDSNMNFENIYISLYNLVSGTTYAIVMWSSGSTYIGVAMKDGDYSDGKACFSDDSGNSWVDAGGICDFSWSVSGIPSAASINTNVIDLSEGTLYHFRVKATNSDGTGYGSDKSFLTYPSAPDGVTSTSYKNAINLTWMKGSGANRTLIRWSTTSYPLNITDGTELYNNTGTNTNHTGLIPATMYFYSMWSFTIWGSEWKYSSVLHAYSTTTYNMNESFLINYPEYLEVGDYIFAFGTIINSSGSPINYTWVYTNITDIYGNIISGSETRFFVVNGFFYYVFSTSTMAPGIYFIHTNFTDSGSNYNYTKILYLSTIGGSGHISTSVHFTFYNSDTGEGIDPSSFKLYADNELPLTGSDRIYSSTFFNTYTGDTIYYRVDDYFNNQVYPPFGSYQTISIITPNQIIDIPIIWYDLAIKNLNYTIMHFSMQSGLRTYTITLFPMDSVHINVLPGYYIITMDFYSSYNGSFIKTVSDGVSVSADGFFIATGYTALVYFSWYNTNEGLGLPVETLKLYINNMRIYDMKYYAYINQTINITVKDYYNQTMYSGNYTISDQFTSLDFGLTFHSYKFSNLNDEYYVIGFLKSGADRWYEKIISAFGDENFLIPSGNYTIRVYNAGNTSYISWSEIVDRSKGYTIEGSNITLIIEGLSVVSGQILELRTEISDALMPDVEIIGCNVPLLYNIMDRIGMTIGNQVIKVCPSIIVQATTRVETDGNWINSTARIPGNDTVENGTITLLNDILYISGPWNTTWVNITYTDNGSLFQNTSYIPSKIHLVGQNITINGSNALHILRETEYNQQNKFTWSYTASTGYYEAGCEVNNPLNVPIFDVYVYMEFANNTNPDSSTVIIKDYANNGAILERGVNYQVSNSGINFYIPNIDSGGSRNFTINYYKEFNDNYYYGEEQVDAGYIERDKVLDGEYYRYVEFIWINDKDKVFRGGLLVKFDETKITEIDKSSVLVYDLDNGIVIDESDYIVGDTFIRIGFDAMGDVSAGGGRNFGIYFQELVYPGANPEVFHLTTPVFYLGMIPFTPFLMLFIACISFIIIGVLSILGNKKNVKNAKILISISCFVLFVFFLLQNMGI